MAYKIQLRIFVSHLMLSPPKLVVLTSLALVALLLGVTFALPEKDKELGMITIGERTVLLAEFARDHASRIKGLSGRDSLAENSGMLFVFDSVGYPAIWMKEMKFALDIIWIRNGKVVDIEENVPVPSSSVREMELPTYTPDVPARLVFEVNAGFSKKFNIHIGDPVTIIGSDGSKIEFKDEDKTPPTGKSADKFPGSEYYIETLRGRTYRGANFKIEKVMEENEAYRKMRFSYKFGDLNLSGVMNIPRAAPPPEGFPVLILNHGLIGPEIYFSGRGSKREQDFFVRKGYVTVHPDYRYHNIEPTKEKSYADPSPRGLAHHDFYVGYTEDVLALITALKEYGSPLLDLSSMGMWAHSMGGGIVARIMVLNPDIKAYVLFAPLSAEVEDNFYELPANEVDWLRKTYGPEQSKVYTRISPLTYFDDVLAPVQLHHGTADKEVPLAFSESMFRSLKNRGKKVEFFVYPGEAHEFGNAWSLAAERSLQFFDKYVKGAR